MIKLVCFDPCQFSPEFVKDEAVGLGSIFVRENNGMTKVSSELLFGSDVPGATGVE